MPPVTLTWYDGGKKPPPSLVGQPLVGQPLVANGMLLVGERGNLYALDDFGSSYKLLPQARFAGIKLDSGPMPEVAHHREWIAACKEGTPTMANFDFAAVLTEAVLLGNVALRAGQKITWDAASQKALDCPQADQYLRREYRAGWSL